MRLGLVCNFDSRLGARSVRCCKMKRILMRVRGVGKTYLAEFIHFAEVDVLVFLVVVLLASNDGNHVTGRFLEVDGGSEVAPNVLDLNQTIDNE